MYSLFTDAPQYAELIPFTSEQLGASLAEWTFRTLNTNGDLASSLPLRREIRLSGEPLLIIGRLMGVKRALFIICLHLPVPGCLLVEEILVAAVPDVIIIQHGVFYLLSGSEANESFLKLVSTKDKSADGHVCRQCDENKMQRRHRVTVYGMSSKILGSFFVLISLLFVAFAYKRGTNVLNYNGW